MIEKKKPVQLPLNYSRKTPFVPIESLRGYPGKDGTPDIPVMTLDQRLNERARIQREMCW